MAVTHAARLPTPLGAVIDGEVVERGHLAACLHEALRESGYVALAEFAMRRRQHAVVIRPGSTGIIAHTMYYPDEIRKGEEFRADLDLAGKKELGLARTLIENTP